MNKNVKALTAAAKKIDEAHLLLSKDVDLRSVPKDGRGLVKDLRTDLANDHAELMKVVDALEAAEA